MPLMRIIGIDPGLRHTGFGVIEVVNSQLLYVSSGTIDIPTNLPIVSRLKVILDSVRNIVKDTKPTVAAIEIIFMNNNPASTLLLGQARGAAICAIADLKLPLYEYTALQIKKSIVGTGRASKIQMQIMVKYLLSLNGLPSLDSADALACAICHFHIDSFKDKLFNNVTNPHKKVIRKIKNGRFIL